MMILGIDSSGITASVAIIDEINDIAVAEYTVNTGKTHSETLLPMIDEIMRLTGTAKDEIGAVAVAAGPGSFTGLRIGSATAKAIAMAADVPIIEVPTLLGLAYNFRCEKRLVCPMMDARRNQVYSALYGFEEGKTVVYKDQSALALEEMTEFINSLGKEVVFLGDGTDAYRDEIVSSVKVPYVLAPSHLNRQNAASVAVLASEMYAEGKVVNADDHSPEYLRVSQAEREGAKDFNLT
jgi:tRNA threonylcarbamoyladenosine biosynthesis protein TsaB